MVGFFPSHVYFLISFKCNQRCSKCRHWEKPQDEIILEPDTIVSALWALAPVEEFCIVGGEPLVHYEAVLRILEGTSELGHRTVIITNGVQLTSAVVDELARYNIHLVVSIDTLDRGFWRYVRGADSYERVVSNLDYAVKVLLPEQLSIQSVRAKETEPYLEEVRRYCDERGLYHSIQDYVQDGFGGEWTESNPNLRSTTIDSGGSCFAVGRNLSIDPYGNVNTCFQQYLLPGCADALGNLNESSMGEILASSYAQSVQKAMRACRLPCRVLKCNQEN